jgi:hypothetical protein
VRVSSFARAQLATASSSSRAEGKAMRLAFDSFSSGAQLRTSMPCLAQASKKSCTCSGTTSKA